MAEVTVEQMNEAIARFMGMQGTSEFIRQNYHYHKDWNLLMDVVIRIKYDENVRLLLPSNGIDKSVWPHIEATQFMNRRLIRADITGTHQGIYQFITWYNDNQQKQNNE